MAAPAGRQRLTGGEAARPGQPTASAAVPDVQAALGGIARAHRDGDFAQALALCGALLSEHSGDVRLWAYTGAAALELGRLDIAVTAFETAARLAPDAPALSRLAAVYGRAGRYRDAAEAYALALARAPGDRQALLGRAEALMRDGRPGEAAGLLGEHSREGAADEEFAHLHGRALWQAGDPSGAAARLEEAADLAAEAAALGEGTDTRRRAIDRAIDRAVDAAEARWTPAMRPPRSPESTSLQRSGRPTCASGSPGARRISPRARPVLP